MSPREKHVPDNAVRTTVALTADERAAIRWISEVRRNQRNRRTTTNDIVVDALWRFVESDYGKTRDQIKALVPVAPTEPRQKTKIAEMPKPKNSTEN
jgi:hypothetical protein